MFTQYIQENGLWLFNKISMCPADNEAGLSRVSNQTEILNNLITNTSTKWTRYAQFEDLNTLI